MDHRKQKQLAVLVCALICSEKPKTQRRKRRLWTKTWLERRKPRGWYSLQRDLEAEDRSGFMQFAMTSEEFDILLGRVGPLITRQDTKMRKAISARQRLSLTLQFLATGEPYKSLSLRYRMGASTVSAIVVETCEALHQVLKEEFLRTPKTEAEWRTIAEEFQHKWQFPHCVGALDGRRIHIQPQGHSGSTFQEDKGISSILMMAAVDANYRFLYISVGTEDRASDAGLFAQSDLRRALDCGFFHHPPTEPLPNSDVAVPYTFIGDDAYPLRTDLMKPYSSGQMDHRQKIFNYRLSRAQRVGENAFGILANRWRVFRSTVLLHPDKVGKITMAAVCLHNFLCERRSEVYLPAGLPDREDADHSLVEGTWRREGLGAMHPFPSEGHRKSSFQAEQQRDNLKDYFTSPAGLVPWQEDYALNKNQSSSTTLSDNLSQ